jgi:hypothetical protein
LVVQSPPATRNRTAQLRMIVNERREYCLGGSMD